MMNTKMKQLCNAKYSDKINFIIILFIVCIILLPLILKPGEEYEGADEQVKEVITEINLGYEPWVSSIYEPPSSEIETLLFSLQSALGAGIIGYYLGMKKRK